jgi:phage portal protein BeeE
MVYYMLMGLFDRFLTNQAPAIQTDVSAGNVPYNVQQSAASLFYGAATATREQAMSVPSLARARNIICSTIGSLPLETYNHFTKEHLRPQRVIMQPDPRIAGSAIYSWLAEDLLFTGNAYGVVLDQYSSSDGARIRSWTRVAPNRVSYTLNSNSTEITAYQIDGLDIPVSGVGSIIVFSGLDEGVLNRAGRTIRAALELEKAAELYAKEPVPTMVLKSN